MTRQQVIKGTLLGLLPMSIAELIAMFDQQQVLIYIGSMGASSALTLVVDRAGWFNATSHEGLLGSMMRPAMADKSNMQVIIDAPSIQFSFSNSNVTTVCLSRRGTWVVEDGVVRVMSQSRTEKGH
jgi:hypothetical protein